MLTAVIGLFGVVIGAVVVALVNAEARGWIPHLCNRLVRRAAGRLPDAYQDRVEEWESELGEYQDRPLTMLLTALRIALNAGAVVREALETASETTDGRQVEHTATLAWAGGLGGTALKMARSLWDRFLQSTEDKPRLWLGGAVISALGSAAIVSGSPIVMVGTAAIMTLVIRLTTRR